VLNHLVAKLSGGNQASIDNPFHIMSRHVVGYQNRLVHLSECKQLTQLSLRAILGIEPDFRMAISMRNKVTLFLLMSPSIHSPS
jgi:hypothetical protein